MAYNVPDVDGVPPLSFVPGSGAGIALLVSDALSYFQGSFRPQWGIFSGGAPVVIAESCISVEYRQEYLVSNYPLEMGAFAAYNKVQVPFDVRVRLSAGSTFAARTGLLESIAAIAGDT